MRVSIKKSMLWGGLGFIVLLGVLLILPRFLHPDYVQGLVLRQIQQTFGSHVSVGQTSFALFPSPHFLVSDLVVKEQPDSHAVFRARSMSLKLGIGQLFQKKLVVREFSLDQPEIEIHRDRAGNWRFLGHAQHDSSLSSLVSFLVLGKLVVSHGKIIVIDESPSESVRGVVIENVAWLSESSYEEAKMLSTLALSGNLRQVHDSAPFSLTGTLEATTKTTLSSRDHQDILFKQVMFVGSMETDKFEVNQLAGVFPDAQGLSQFPGTVKVESQIKWVKNETGSQVQFSHVGLAASAMTLEGHGNIEELTDGHHMVSVSMRSSSLDLEMFRKTIPQAWLPERFVDVWNRGDWGGEVEILDVRVTGSTRDDVDTSVAGTFQIKNGFLYGADWPNTDHVRGTVVVEPDRIHVTEAKGIYDGIPVEVKQGVLLLKESGPWGDVDIEGMVSAEKVWDVVNHLGDSSSGSSNEESWNISQGSGMLQLRFAGPVFDEQGLAFQHGDYQPQNVMLTVPGFPHPLTNGHGHILFSPDSTELEGIQGDVGGYPLTMDGTIIHQDILRLEPLHVTAGFDGQDLLTDSEQGLSGAGVQVTGPLRLSVTMRGPMKRLKLKGSIDGEHALLSIPSVLQKAAGQAGLLEFDGQVQGGNTVRFKRIELAMLPLRLRARGLLRFGQVWGWKGQLDSGPISLELIPPKVRLLGNAIQSGILDVQLRGNGVGSDWTTWNMRGWVALTEGVVPIPGMQETMSNVFVRLKIEKDLLDLKRMEFRIKESAAVVTGFMKHWKTTPQVSMMWDSPRFDLDLLVPKEERSVLRDGIEWLANHGTLEGSFFVERPFYKAFSGRKLSAALHIHDNLVSVENIQSSIETHGSLKGRVFVHLPPGKPAAMRASFEGSHVPFEKVLTVLGDDHRIISGNMDIRGTVQGHGRHARGIIPTLTGNIQLSLQDGYVRKGVILPQILRLLNLPHVLRGKVSFEKTGFPFDSVSTTMNIEEGTFSTKDFLLRSPIMKATAAGTYDLDRDHLDGVTAISPFGSYTETLQSIPLFGKIFAGDRQGLATAMFRVIGPLAEPHVVYLPQESLTAGLKGFAQFAFDVLSNTVLAPVRALNGSLNDSTSSPPESPRSDSTTPSKREKESQDSIE